MTQREPCPAEGVWLLTGASGHGCGPRTDSGRAGSESGSLPGSEAWSWARIHLPESVWSAAVPGARLPSASSVSRPPSRNRTTGEAAARIPGFAAGLAESGEGLPRKEGFALAARTAHRPLLQLACAVLLAIPPVLATAAGRAPVVTARPKIGLVLSGGGARGAAHIGVL